MEADLSRLVSSRDALFGATSMAIHSTFAMVPTLRMSRWSRVVPTLAVVAALIAAGCSDRPNPITPSTPGGQRELPIAPIAQQTEVWCWAASAEMILRYYNEPNLNPAGNYQCGVVGGYYYLLGGPSHPCVSNCFLCQSPASSAFEIQSPHRLRADRPVLRSACTSALQPVSFWAAESG